MGIAKRDAKDDPRPIDRCGRDSRSTRLNGQVSTKFQMQRSIWVLGVFAEFETNLRKERLMEGIAKAKAVGVY